MQKPLSSNALFESETDHNVSAMGSSMAALDCDNDTIIHSKVIAEEEVSAGE